MNTDLEYSQHYTYRLKTREVPSIPSLLLCLLTNFEIPLAAAGAFRAFFPRVRALRRFIW